MECCHPSLEVIGEPEKKKQKLEDIISMAEHDVTTDGSKNNGEGDEEIQKLEDKCGGLQWDDLYDSDDYSDPETREADFQKYNQQVKASGGFQVDDFSKLSLFGMFSPIPDHPETDEYLRTFSQLAIDDYNKKSGGLHYKLVRVVRATLRGCAGAVYYITFEAKLAAGDVETFQAMVYKKIPPPDIEVISCNLKATDESKVI